MSPDDGSFDLMAQLRAHLHSLKAAGVQILPRGPALELPRVAPAEASMPTPAAGVARAENPAAISVPPSAPDTPDERRQALQVLASEISNCDLCGELFSTRIQTVFGSGPADAEVAFVGEAPGADEDRGGQPFIGKAGQLLTRIITRCGFARTDVYIMNTLKCRPPNNRQPTPTECENCRPYFERQFDLVRPKYAVALGLTAARALLQTNDSLSRLRGKVYQYRGRPLIVTYHPSALLRDQSKSMWWDCWEDMKLLLKTMGRPIPEGN